MSIIIQIFFLTENFSKAKIDLLFNASTFKVIFERTCLPVCLFVCVSENRILNHGSNQKMIITKVVRLTIKVNLVKKIPKIQKKSDQNGIKWNKLQLQLQSKYGCNKRCQAYHKCKFGRKIV